jgi:alkanesulfonate monooxygenase SsuD/methylene tetrahydromethanopterin reductase-like flavin-dependent oxidoreductase (luciferase family)
VTRLGIWLTEPDPAQGGGAFDGMSNVAQAAEAVGFDSLWVSDSTRPLDRLTIDRSPIFEAYSLLGALATKTRSIRLGALPSAGSGRAPAVLAKIVTGLDVISHGRSILSLFSPSDAPNGDRLAEEIRVCRAVLDDDVPEFAGRHYQINGAVNRPKPMQRDGVPVVVVIESGDGGRSPDRSEGLRIAARYADAVVVNGDLDAIGEVADVVRSSPHARDQNSRSGSTEVIWVGELVRDHGTADSPPTLTSELATQQLKHRFRAGADGCIIRLDGENPLETIAQMGPALSDVVGDMPTKSRPSRQF